PAGSSGSAWTGSQSADAGPRSSTRRSPVSARGRRLPARLRPPRPGDVRVHARDRPPRRRPQRAGVAIFDVVTGLHAAIGILAALMERGERGEGQHIALNLLSSALSGWSTRPRATRPRQQSPAPGQRPPEPLPLRALPDGRPGHHHLRGQREPVLRMCQALGVPDLATDPRFCSVRLRNVNGTSCASSWSRPSPPMAWTTGPRPCRPSAFRAPPSWTSPRACSARLTRPGADRPGGQPRDPAGPLIRNPVTFSRTPVAYPKPRPIWTRTGRPCVRGSP
ncbi:hypothetical protein GS507_29040, partial [Rhodococcus hoagii]|nr:hypothetical protein [Prescottella equi]